MLGKKIDRLTIAEAILLRAYRLEAEEALIVFIVTALIVERGVLFGGFEKVSWYRTSAGVVVDCIECVTRELVLTNRAQLSDGVLTGMYSRVINGYPVVRQLRGDRFVSLALNLICCSNIRLGIGCELTG